MSVNYPTTIKNARLQIVVDAIDAGAGNGMLQIGTAAFATLLSTITLDKPSFSVSGGAMTLLGVPLTDLDAAADGTPAAAVITDDVGNVIVSGLTVGVAGSGPGGSDPDIVITTATIVQHNEVRCDSGVIVHA